MGATEYIHLLTLSKARLACAMVWGLFVTAPPYPGKLSYAYSIVEQADRIHMDQGAVHYKIYHTIAVKSNSRSGRNHGDGKSVRWKM